MLDKRLTNLLRLLTQGEFQTAEQLAGEMNLSTKTLRNLVKELDENLEKNGAHIIVKRGEGFKLAVTDLEAFQTLFISPSKTIPSGSDERVNFIIEQFLKNNDYIKMDDICDAVFVSRKTLAADMKKAEKFFHEFDLKIKRKPHYGMQLSGDEFKIRRCLVRYQEIKRGAVSEIETDINEYESQIADCILDILEKEEYHISDVGLHSLIMHMDVAVHRIRTNQYISIKKEDYSQFIGQREYILAKKCAEAIGRKLGVVFTEEEIGYLAIHFAGKESNQNFIISSDIQDAVTEMLQEVYEVFQLDLRKDLDLVMLLGRHLVPLVIRMKYGMRLKNPLLKEVKERYSLAYTIASQASAVLERRYHTVVDSNEISYLAMAFALSLERSKVQKEKKRVLFVCASGTGTAQLMAYKIQEIFGEYISEILICDQLSITKQDFNNIDYVFTTVPIAEKIPIPICEVKGFLEGMDTMKIQQFLHSSQEQKVIDYYPEELFFTGIYAENKEEILQEIIRRVREKRTLPKGFYKSVLKREELARTCMGNYVAMPHPCIAMTEDTFVSVTILDKAIQWDESQMVQVIFLVSVSKKKNKKIQNFYSATAKLLLNGSSIETLIQEKSYPTLVSLLELSEIGKVQ